MKRTTNNKFGEEDFDENMARDRRNKLYLLRLNCGTNVYENSLNFHKFNVFKDLNLKSRERQLFKPLLIITGLFAPIEEIDILKDFVKNYLEENRFEYEETDEAVVLRALHSIMDCLNKQKRIVGNDVFIANYELREKIIMADPEAYRYDNDGNFHIIQTSATARKYTTQKIGYVLKRLGFKKIERDSDGKIGRRFTMEKVEDALRRLNLL